MPYILIYSYEQLYSYEQKKLSFKINILNDRCNNHNHKPIYFPNRSRPFSKRLVRQHASRKRMKKIRCDMKKIRCNKKCRIQ